jgi:tetratricopeptide (TPR) repeat protein
LAVGLGSWSRAEGTPGAVDSQSPQAQALFERGVFLRGQFRATHESTAPLTGALDAFVEAGRLDPLFGSARAEAAETLVDMSFAGAVGFRDGLTRARETATEALGLMPDDGRAARVMGVAALFLDWNAAASRSWLERALATRDDAKTAMAMAMWSASAGEPDVAVAAAERAVALDPAAYYVRADLAMFYLVAGRNADAARASREVLAVAPDFAPARAYALLAHERLGQWDDAARQAVALMQTQGAPAEELARVSGAHPRAAVAQWRRWDLARLEQQAAGRRPDFALELALRHAALGDRQAALGALETALASRNALLAFLRSYPELMLLRGDPAFEAIARTVSGRALS